jgi:O-antigen ligase
VSTRVKPEVPFPGADARWARSSQSAFRRSLDLGGGHSWIPIAAAVLAVGVAGSGAKKGLFLIILGLAAAIGLAFLRRSSSAILLWLTAATFGTSLTGVTALSLDRLAFLGLLAVWLVEVTTGRARIPKLGSTEIFMLGYLLILVVSAVTPHQYLARNFDSGEYSIITLIQTSAFVPFALYIVARTGIRTAETVRSFLWFLVILGTYLSLTNIFQSVGLNSFVWPRSLLDSSWIKVGRAPGIFDQPSITGFVIAVSLAAALLLASTPNVPFRLLAGLAVLPMGPAIYVTHSRAPLLCMVIILLGGLVFARGMRTGFAILTLVGVLILAANWSAFTSSDREKGGVTSQAELDDRKNGVATSLAVIPEHLFFGHGIGRFAQVNTYEHKQWGLTDWRRGYGIASHETELGIATEFGLVGLALWLGVLGTMVGRVARARKDLPRSGLDGQSFAVIFLLIFAGWVSVGFTNDLRFFDVANGLLFCWGGIAVGIADHHREIAAAAS